LTAAIGVCAMPNTKDCTWCQRTDCWRHIFAL